MTRAVLSNSSAEREPTMKLNFVNTGCVLAPSSGQIPVNRQRRTFIGGAVAAVLVSSMPVKADFEDLPNDPFILLLHGIYHAVPAGGGPIRQPRPDHRKSE